MTTFPAIEVGLAYLPPLTFAASRYYVSATVPLACTAATTEYWSPRTRRDRLAVAAGGRLFIGGTGFTFLGQQYIAGGLAAIVVSHVPVPTVAFGWTMLPAERPSPRGIVGVLVGLVGVVPVVRPSAAALIDPSGLGRSLVALAAVLVALGSVLVRRCHAELPAPR